MPIVLILIPPSRWDLFGDIPEQELTRISPELRKKYYKKKKEEKIE